jgi:hypothetical protein
MHRRRFAIGRFQGRGETCLFLSERIQQMKYIKGQSGNIFGRPRGARNIKTREAQEACRQLAEGCFSQLEDAIKDPTRQSWAIPLCLGYAFGKPYQIKNVNVSSDDSLESFLNHIDSLKAG